MTALMFEELLDEAEQEAPAMNVTEAADHMEEDVVDWCAWWAEYGEMME